MILCVWNLFEEKLPFPHLEFGKISIFYTNNLFHLTVFPYLRFLSVRRSSSVCRHCIKIRHLLLLVTNSSNFFKRCFIVLSLIWNRRRALVPLKGVKNGETTLGLFEIQVGLCWRFLNKIQNFRFKSPGSESPKYFLFLYRKLMLNHLVINNSKSHKMLEDDASE